MNGYVQLDGQLELLVIRSDGSVIDRGIVSGSRLIIQPRTFWRRLWARLRREAVIPLWMSFPVFLAWAVKQHYGIDVGMLALVTDVGINFMTGDFGANGNDVSTMNFHESGTTATAAAVTDTDLLGKIPLARVAGSQSTPATKQFRSSGTVLYNSTYTVQEWGLFSSAGSGLPPTGGILWDRRVIAPSQGVNNNDQVQYKYTCTGTSGGV